MLYRRLEHPKTGAKCLIEFNVNQVLVIQSNRKKSGFWYNLTPRQGTRRYEDETKARLSTGWVELANSQSRQGLRKLGASGRVRYWIIEIEERSCHLVYGRFDEGGLWSSSYDNHDTVYYKDDEATRRGYVSLIRKKLKQGYVHAEKRANEFWRLLCEASSKPARVKPQAQKPARSARAPRKKA